MSFWEKYEKLCTARGLSPTGKEMCTLLNTTSAGITYWKQKNTSPKDFEIYKKLANFFDVDVLYLIGMSDSPIGDTISEITEQLEDLGVEVHTYDNDTGEGQIYVLSKNGKSKRCQAHEYRHLCDDLMTQINDAKLSIVELWVNREFPGNEIQEEIIPYSCSPEEFSLIQKYRQLPDSLRSAIKTLIEACHA